MRMTPENKEKARAAIVDAAGRLFREQGMAATGIDGIARETGQTSGALYAHFPSKADVFRDAVEAGFRRLAAGIARSRKAGGERFARLFAQAYLATAHRDAIGQGCLLPALPNDAMRAGADTHRLFGERVVEAANQLAAGCGEGERAQDRALAILALCAGGIMLSRAIADGAASDRMLKACQDAAAELIGGDP
jgi:TetR/AcrR family transcriptional repressor of nem operon